MVSIHLLPSAVLLFCIQPLLFLLLLAHQIGMKCQCIIQAVHCMPENSLKSLCNFRGFVWSICPDIGIFMQWHCRKICSVTAFTFSVCIFYNFHFVLLNFLSKPSVLHPCFCLCSQQSIWQHQIAQNLFVNSFIN